MTVADKNILKDEYLNLTGTNEGATGPKEPVASCRMWK